MSEKYSSWSLYIYVGNNPMKFVNPTGMYPIYDEDGNFFGTDEFGLQGIAHVMNKNNFKHGMSITDVRKYSSTFNNEEALNKL